MSGIYISGMKMPKDNPVIIKICPDGSVSRANVGVVATAIPVQDHGRLIEEHDARLAFYSVYQEHGLPWQNAEVILEKCKTILPSDYSFDGREDENADR